MRIITFVFALIGLAIPIAASSGEIADAANAPSDERNWEDVQSWVYQLCNYEDGRLDAIAEADFDLAVIDLARTGGDDNFTAEEIAAVKASGKFVLAYFEIGAIEEYRPEWSLVPEELKAGSVDGWPKEQYVRYWDQRWWPIVKGRVDRAIKAGFDGAYLDMVTTYEEIPNTGLTSEERARLMVELIVRISRYAKAAQPNFKILPQNCPELYTWSYWDSQPNEEYLAAIDGIGLESVFYIAHDIPADESWCRENRENAVSIRKAGKLVLGVDYAINPSSVADSMKRQKALGFAPYVSVVELDKISENPELVESDRDRGA